MELHAANKQWSTRPPDERFSSLEALHEATSQHRARSVETTRPYAALSVAVEGNEPVLVGPNGGRARFTHWSFGQLSARVGAPASYLRELPPALAADNLNHGLQKLQTHDDEQERDAKILFHRNGELVAHALTSERYTRIWNADVTSRLLRLVERAPEWQPAPPAQDGSRGLYASDRDMFTFLVDNDRRVFERAPGGGLSRGFFCWNSEVGAASFGIMTFYYAYVCGNHIVWGARGVSELRIRHIGAADDKAFGALAGELRRYADSSASEDEARIESARRMVLGKGKNEVLDAVFRLRVPELSRKTLELAYDAAEEHAEWYGDPRSVWGMVSGLTEVSQRTPYADERVRLDRAAGKVLQIAF